MYSLPFTSIPFPSLQKKTMIGQSGQSCLAASANFVIFHHPFPLMTEGQHI